MDAEILEKAYFERLLTFIKHRPVRHHKALRVQARHVARWYAENRLGRDFDLNDREDYINDQIIGGRLLKTARNEFGVVSNYLTRFSPKPIRFRQSVQRCPCCEYEFTEVLTDQSWRDNDLK